MDIPTLVIAVTKDRSPESRYVPTSLILSVALSAVCDCGCAASCVVLWRNPFFRGEPERWGSRNMSGAGLLDSLEN